jgi:hypothetical protein
VVHVALSQLRAACSLAPTPPALCQQRLQVGRSARMKVAGASRRSAAPGSQSVGVAEYGDKSFARLCLLDPCAKRNDSFAPLPHMQDQASPPNSSLAHHRTARERATLASLESHSQENLAAPTCGILWATGEASPHSAQALSQQVIPMEPKMRANPSFNLTFSGWLRQPPNAS